MFAPALALASALALAALPVSRTVPLEAAFQGTGREVAACPSRRKFARLVKHFRTWEIDSFPEVHENLSLY